MDIQIELDGVIYGFDDVDVSGYSQADWVAFGKTRGIAAHSENQEKLLLYVYKAATGKTKPTKDTDTKKTTAPIIPES